MLKTFQIDFIRALMEFSFSKNANDTNFFNNHDIKLFSFYEHLNEEEEVNRYVETIKELNRQQNKQSLIGYGIVAATNTPSLVNLKKHFISPFEWGCVLRCTLENRDKMIATIYKMFEDLKGRKCDIACLDNGKLIAVGTIGNDSGNIIHDFDFIGELSTGTTFTSKITNIISDLGENYGFTNQAEYVYCEYNNKLMLFHFEEEDNTWQEVELPEHNSFEKYKLSISFNDLKMNEPFTLNENDYCEITFGGGATLTDNSIRLGNDFIRLEIAKYKIVSSNDGSSDFLFGTTIVGSEPPRKQVIYHTLEPMEFTSGNSATTFTNKLRSNYFNVNTQTDSVATTLQYTFVVDNELLVNQWYLYAKYGSKNINHELGGVGEDIMTPNIIYKIRETYCSWGVIEQKEVLAKIVEDIDISNTDSDILTLGISFQVQGENN